MTTALITGLASLTLRLLLLSNRPQDHGFLLVANGGHQAGFTHDHTRAAREGA